MVSFGSRKGEAGAGALPLMILAFVVAGAFFTWLYFQAAPVDVEVLEEPVDDEQVARIITVEDFAADPMAQEGFLIQVDRLLHTSNVGRGAFFVGLPPSSSYFVKMPAEMLADSVVIESGSTVSVIGTVYPITNADSVADAWVASGHIAESDRILVDFAESYIDARTVRITASPTPQP